MLGRITNECRMTWFISDVSDTMLVVYYNNCDKIVTKEAFLTAFDYTFSSTFIDFSIHRHYMGLRRIYSHLGLPSTGERSEQMISRAL